MGGETPSDSAVVRWADIGFKSTGDKLFFEICEKFSELSWPGVEQQVRNVQKIGEVKAGDWLITRHSNLENRIRMVFHIFRGCADFDLTRIFEIADETGFAKVFIIWENPDFSGLFGAIKNL